MLVEPPGGEVQGYADVYPREALDPAAPAIVKMSSQEIADLTGRKHLHVLRDIRNMLEALKDDPNLDHVEEVKDARGYTVYMRLPRREVEILLTGYSILLRAKVIDRLHELEQAHQAPRIPRNLSEALRLAADLEDQKEALRLQNEAMKPAAEVGEAVGKAKVAINGKSEDKLIAS